MDGLRRVYCPVFSIWKLGLGDCCEIYPITQLAIENVKFDMQLLEKT